jgi:hypothetical protein
MEYRFLFGGVETKVLMDGGGWSVGAVLRAFTEQCKDDPRLKDVPTAAITLKVGEHLLGEDAMIDVELARLRKLFQIPEKALLIDVCVSEDVVAEYRRKLAEVTRSEALTTERKEGRRFVRVIEKQRTDAVSVRRLASSLGAIRRGGFLWLSRRYYVAFGGEVPRWITAGEIEVELSRK